MENNNNSLVFDFGGKLVTFSKQVSDIFDKDHKNLLAKIQALHDSWSLDTKLKNKLSEYFTETTYKDASGKSNKGYYISKDGFTFLAMGFTGREFDIFKVRYIDEFNRMEAELKTIEDVKNQEYRDFVAQLYGEVYNIKNSLELLKDSYNGCNINTTEELTERLRSERWLIDGAISNKGLKELCLVVLDGEICVSKKALDRIRKKIYNDNVKATYNKFNSEDLKGKEIGFKLKDK